MELIDDGRLLSWLIPHPVDGARDELMTPNGVTRAGGDTPVAEFLNNVEASFRRGGEIRRL